MFSAYCFNWSLLVFGYVFVVYPKIKTQTMDNIVFKTLFYVYVCFVLYFTIMPVTLSSLRFFSIQPIAWFAFEDVLLQRPNAIKEVILNIIMLVPFGVLFPLAFNQKVSTTIMMAFFFSVFIELIQPYVNPSRLSDVTDVLTNVIGAIIGVGIVQVLYPVITHIRKSLKKIDA